MPPEADHLEALTAGWRIWKTICLRSAGFPAKNLLSLASAASASAAVRLLDGEAQAAIARRELIAVAKAAIERAPADSGPVRRLLKLLWANKIAEAVEGPPEVADALARLRQATAAVSDEGQRVAAALEEESGRISSQLRTVAADPRFREAVTWQNREAIHRVDDAFRGGAFNSGTRKQERLIASYWQRYCAKNDTIGFFGPIGWASWTASVAGAHVVPGAALIRTRAVLFEYWAIDALAAKLAESLRPHLAPRRKPTVRVAGDEVHYPVGRRAQVPAEYARLLELANGDESAAAIAAHLLADPEMALDDEDGVYQLLGELEDRGFLIWRADLPTRGAHAERDLRRLLERVADDGGRVMLATLDELEANRQTVARSAGDPAALDASLAELQSTFSRLTGHGGTRRHGQLHAGRTLVYEDCQRDLQAQFGPPVLNALTPPLTLLLESARWYTHQIAIRHRQAFGEIYRALRDETGEAEVELVRFFDRAAVYLDLAQPSPIILEVVAELQRRWWQILALDEEQSRVTRQVEELRPRVAAEFAAPGPGWPSARYHSPDIMIAASDVASINRGDFLLVVGEIHAAQNSILQEVYLEQAEARDALIADGERDLPGPVIEWVLSREAMHRGSAYWRSALQVESAEGRAFRDKDAVLAISDLVLEERNGQLVVRARDGARVLDLIALFQTQLSHYGMARFHWLPHQRHTPRVTVGQLVISREKWRIPLDQLGFAHSEDPVERFTGARRFGRSVGLPRFVFYKIPEEPKPCYLDFDSPIYVEMFARIVRKASDLVVTEMLPSFDGLWLPDSDGNVYTCELRTVTVDPVPFVPQLGE
jgi:hypothetical protein